MGKRIRFISLLSIEVIAIILSVVLFPKTLHAAETFLDLSPLCNTAAVPGTGGTTVVIDFDEKVLLDHLGENPTAEYVLIPVNNNVDTAEINLSGRVLRRLGTRNCRVRIINKTSEISFPAAGIDMTAIGEELESHPENVVVRFFISWDNRSTDAFMNGIVEADGMNPVTRSVEFRAEAAAEEKSIELNKYNGYIETTLELSGEININTTAGVRLDRNGKLLPVPTVFGQGNGKTTAVLKHGASGIYAVVENPGEFIDMQGHWARHDVGILASKLIVTGAGRHTFNPEGKITRAQMAVMLSRVLGLVPQVSQVRRFSDFSTSEWFAGEVESVAAEGIMQGYPDGGFRPGEAVTREQAVVIAGRVLDMFAGDTDIPNEKSEQYLARFKDRPAIKSWASRSVAKAVKDGIAAGDENGYFNPRGSITRAECAVLLRKAAVRSGLMSPALNVISPADNMVTASDFAAVSGFVDEGSTVKVNDRPVAVAGGVFISQEELKAGENTITVQTELPSGEQAFLTRTVTYDRSAKGFSLSAPLDDLLTNRGLMAVCGTLEGGGTVVINGIPAAAGPDGIFSRIMELNPGGNVINVSAVTATGEEHVASRTAIYDNKAPELIVYNADNLETGNEIEIITGYTEPGSILKINGDAADADREGNFSKVVDLDVGENIITVLAADRAGNVSVATRTVTFDDNRVSAVQLPEFIKIGPAVSIKYELTLDGYITIKIYNNDGRRIRTLVDSVFRARGSHSQVWDGRNDKSVPAGDGSYRFVVEARDAEGELIGSAEEVRTAARVPVLEAEAGWTGMVGPERNETAKIKFTLSSTALVSAKILRGSAPVKTICTNMLTRSGSHTLSWDGTDDSGSPVPDGEYVFNIEAASETVPAFKSNFRGSVIIKNDTPGLFFYTPLSETAGIQAGYYVAVDEINIGGSRINPQNSEAVAIDFRLTAPAGVTVKILDSRNRCARTILNEEVREEGIVRLIWDGRDDSGQVVPDGNYTFQVMAVSTMAPSFRTMARSAGTVTVETGPPVVTGFNVNPDPMRIGISPLNIRYVLNENASVSIFITDSDGAVIRSLADSEVRITGNNYCTWDGKDDAGSEVPEGIYRVVLKAWDDFNTEVVTMEKTLTAGYHAAVSNVSIRPELFNPVSGEEMQVSYSLSGSAAVTVQVSDSRRVLLRKLADGIYQPEGDYVFSWDGRDDEGRPVGDGIYYIRITAISPAVSSFKSFLEYPVTVETDIPEITELVCNPDPFLIYRQGVLRIRYRLRENAAVSVDVLKNGALVKSIINQQRQPAGNNFVFWDGNDSSGRPAEPGKYRLDVRAVDPAGKTDEVSKTVTVYPYPAVVSYEPEDEGSDVPVDSPVIIQFCDRVQQGPDFNKITLTVEGRKVGFVSRITGDTLTLTPSQDMAFGTAYTLEIPARAVGDICGKLMETPFTMSFTTEKMPRPGESCPEVDLSGAVTSSYTILGQEPVMFGVLDEKKALAIVENQDSPVTVVVPVTVSGNNVNITFTGGLIESLAEKDGLIKLLTPKAAMKIPAQEIPVMKLAEGLESQVSEVTVNITVSEADAGEKGEIAGLAVSKGLRLLAEPVKFKIEAGAGDRYIPVEMFDRYVEYTVFLENGAGLDEAGCGAAATAAVGDELSPLPARLSLENGKAAVIIKSRVTSTFTVVQTNREFRDMENHWAKEEVADLASGLIVSGNENGLFAPESRVTRAQFATIIARALGLEAEGREWQEEGTETGINFSDVIETSWYAPAVKAAAAEGLVTGYGDRTFRPDNYIRREEAAVLITRALAITGTEDVFDGNRPRLSNSALSRFKDGNAVSSWARSAVTESMAWGIVRGDAKGCFAPGKFVTRAEAAVMVRRMLSKAGLV